MAYKALYRTYRPDSFEEMAGQGHIVKTLKNIVQHDKIAHAYLFCGPRGTGKTSSAKIFAKAVNCTGEDKPCGVCDNCKAVQEGSHPDIIEIDAASNNGVEEVRNLIDKVKYAPIMGKYKIYIIDEVHMMSQGAYNALLKTIEEPPAHVIFIFATTEPYKVLPTIISRCQRYDFSKISNKDIFDKLNSIVEKANIAVTKEALEEIAVLADGGMRDALSILDQCYAYAPDGIELSHVFEIYGVITVEEKIKLLSYIVNKQVKEVMENIESFDQRGIDIKRLTSDLIEVLKEKIVFDYTSDDTLLSVLDKDEVHQLQGLMDTQTTLTFIDILMDNYEKFKYANNVISYMEIAVLKMISNVSRETLSNSTTQDSPIKKEPVVAQNIDTMKTIEDDNQIKKVDAIQEIQKESMKKDEHSIEDTSMIVSNIDDIDEESIEIEEPIVNEGIQFNEPKVEEIVKIHDDEYILSLLVGANKEEKNEDKAQMNGIHNYKLEMETAKYANMLAPTEIVASGSTYFIVVTKSQAMANEINEMDKDKEFHSFINLLFKKNKKVFAINDVQYSRVVEEFKSRAASQSLPQAAIVEIEEIKVVEEEKKDETMEELNILFGSNITIEE